DIHDLEYRLIPAGTELTLMMTTPTNGVDTGIGVKNIIVSAVPFLSGPTVLQAELHDHSIGVVSLPSSDEGGGEMVAFDATGDEISYDVNVPAAGTYLVGFRVASGSGSVNLELAQDGTPLTTLNRLIDAGETWTTVYKMIALQAGSSTLTVSATAGETQLLNWFELTASAESATMVDLPFADGFDDGFAPIWDSTAFLSGAAYEGEKSAKMNNTDYVETGIDTTGHSGIQVTYARNTAGLSAGSSFISEWFDGTSWNAIESISSGFSAWEVVSQIELPAGADHNPDFRLRFRVNAGSDYGYVDSVVVEGVNLPVAVAMNADAISFEWPNIPGATYAVQCSTNLMTDAFSGTVESGIPALTGTNSIAIEIPDDPAAFYRIITE
ncbi:carbohydrate-binding protein, partial [Pontiella sp.]|uniref:carbohydrate-binding protein n=1 Tax=Pontiella sp. TaxID=2837462 RepID=UPI0035660F8B